MGIIAVDLFGQPADYAAIHEVAQAHGLWVIADAAQSFGATWRDRKVGTLAKLTTTSFFPAKPLGCYGDGGAVFTDDPELAAVIRSLRVHGQGEDKYDNVRIGINGRLDTLQAAILLTKLDIFADEIQARQRAAERYDALARRSGGDAIVAAGGLVHLGAVHDPQPGSRRAQKAAGRRRHSDGRLLLPAPASADRLSRLSGGRGRLPDR